MSKKRKRKNKKKYNRQSDLYSIEKAPDICQILEEINQFFIEQLDDKPNNVEISEKNIYCSKCDSGNIYPIYQIIVNNKNKNSGYEYKKYWFVLRQISKYLKEKVLFLNFSYNKTRLDLMNSMWLYIYIIFVVLSITCIFFAIYYNPNLCASLIRVELWVITFIFSLIISMNYMTYSSCKKKFYTTYCCPSCERLFQPVEYRVRLKKNTSIFVKMHLAYKKLTRRKFYNVRYVTYQVEQEMKRLRMR